MSNIRGGLWVLGEWSFIALTYDGDTLMLYVDGEMVGEKDVGQPDEEPHAAVVPYEGEIWMGSWKAPNWGFVGALDEAAIFNVPLDAEDIVGIMNSGLQETTLAVSRAGKIAAKWGYIKDMR